MASVPKGLEKKALKEWKKHGALNIDKYFEVDDNLFYAVKLDQIDLVSGTTSDFFG